MRRFYTILIAFIAFAAHAQITEKDLLGEWKLTTATMHGVILNFETGTATEEPGKEGTYTADDLKKMERGIQGLHPFPVMVRFKTGSTIEIITETTDPGKAELETRAYTLEHKDGHTFLVNTKEQWEVRLESGLMRFIFTTPEDSTQIIMNYKK